MDENAFALFAIGLVFLLTFLYTHRDWREALAPLPPGPKGLPLLGNVIDLPPSQPWETFARWGKTYGMHLAFDICRSLTLFSKVELYMSAPLEIPSLCSTM